MVSQRGNLSEEEAQARVDQAVTDLEQARTEAEAMARDAAETARTAAILTAFVLTAAPLLAGASAVAGAVRGGHHRDEGRLFGGLSYRL